MTLFLPARRQFLTGAASAATMALSGCDAVDAWTKPGHPVRGALAAANGLTWRAQRLLTPRDALADEFAESDIRQPMRPNGVTAPPDEDWKALARAGFAGYRLNVGGLVENPLSLSLDNIRAIPAHTQITRHDCVEGWSCIAKWTGAPLAFVLAEARPRSEARYVLFRCFDSIERGLSGAFKYYETIDMVDAFHPQTILAYGMNGAALPAENGAPLRLRVERQLGYKMAKYVKSIELVADFAGVEGGFGGYWEDRGYDWYAGI